MCSSHGFCGYDSHERKAYCYCNEGYSGDACDILNPGALGDSSGNIGGLPYSTLANLMIILLVITVALVLSVLLMGYRVIEYRKKQEQHMQLVKADRLVMRNT